VPDGGERRALIARRLANQRLLGARCRTPADAVAWLGAVQSQDYHGAKWAVAQRISSGIDAAVERAFDRGEILRTHILRPTWHFVTPADIRWMIALTGPRVRRTLAPYDRRLGIDASVLTRSFRVVERALRDHAYRTRAELGEALAARGIAVKGQALAHIAAHAELTGLICSGPRRGKQSTYALLEERAAPVPAKSREESLAELTRRYFASHGPATVRDFVWWSGLTVGDARAGLAAIGARSRVVGDLTFWSLSPRLGSGDAAGTLHLLPNYDEYLVAYQDRALVADARRTMVSEQRADRFAYHLVVDGRLAGSWRGSPAHGAVMVEVAPYRTLSAMARRALGAAVDRYARFVGGPVRVSHHPAPPVRRA
jgi:hypothetical protein